MPKLDVFDMEELSRLESSEKTTVTLGPRRYMVAADDEAGRG